MIMSETVRVFCKKCFISINDLFFYILVDTPRKHFSVVGGLLLKNLQLCSTVIKFAVMSSFKTVKFERRRHRTSLQTEQRKVKWRRIHNPGGKQRLRPRFSKRPFPDKRLVSAATPLNPPFLPRSKWFLLRKKNLPEKCI